MLGIPALSLGKQFAKGCNYIMVLRTRGSVTLDKAQRRLANLKSIDENLNLGHGLTITTYTQLIETTREALDAHNTLVSNIDASRRHLTELEKALSAMSERMLMGVGTKYGRTSFQYGKAGGSIRKSRRTSITEVAEAIQPMPPAVMTNEAVMTNGRAN